MIVEFKKDTPHYRGKGLHKKGDITIVNDEFAEKLIKEEKAVRRETTIPSFLDEVQKENIKKLKNKNK